MPTNDTKSETTDTHATVAALTVSSAAASTVTTATTSVITSSDSKKATKRKLKLLNSGSVIVHDNDAHKSKRFWVYDPITHLFSTEYTIPSAFWPDTSSAQLQWFALDNTTIYFEIIDVFSEFETISRFQFNITTQQFTVRDKKNEALAYLYKSGAARIDDQEVVFATPPNSSVDRTRQVKSYNFRTQQTTQITSVVDEFDELCANDSGKQLAIRQRYSLYFFPLRTYTIFSESENSIKTAGFNTGTVIISYLPNSLLLSMTNYSEHPHYFPEPRPVRTFIQVCDPQTLESVTIKFKNNLFPHCDLRVDSQVKLTRDSRKLFAITKDETGIDFVDLRTLQMSRMNRPLNTTGPITSCIMDTNGSLLLTMEADFPNQIIEVMPDFMVAAEKCVQEKFAQQIQTGILDKELLLPPTQSGDRATTAATLGTNQTRLSELNKDCLNIIMQYAVSLRDVSNSLIAKVMAYPDVSDFWKELQTALPTTENPRPFFAAGKNFEFPSVIQVPATGGLVNIAYTRFISISASDEKSKAAPAPTSGAAAIATAAAGTAPTPSATAAATAPQKKL